MVWDSFQDYGPPLLGLIRTIRTRVDLVPSYIGFPALAFTYGLPAAAGCSAEMLLNSYIPKLVHITMRYLGRIFVRIVDNNMHEKAPIWSDASDVNIGFAMCTE